MESLHWPNKFCPRQNSTVKSTTSAPQKEIICKKIKRTIAYHFKEHPVLLTSSSICSHFVHSSSKFVFSAKSAILDFLKRKESRVLFRTFSELLPNGPKVLRRFIALLTNRVGTGRSYSNGGSHPQAMHRSIGRLSGIASVFSRGFRSTASVAMPIKVRLTFFSFNLSWEKISVRSSDMFFSSLRVRNIKLNSSFILYMLKIFDLSYKGSMQGSESYKALLLVFPRCLFLSFTSNRSADLASFHFIHFGVCSTSW